MSFIFFFFLINLLMFWCLQIYLKIINTCLSKNLVFKEKRKKNTEDVFRCEV